jgi:hypothetical protein
MTIDVACINRTRRIRDARFASLLPALQAQLNEDFSPVWQVEPVRLLLVGKRTRTIPTTQQRLWFLDDSDDPGALGYHEDDTGTPEGKVFCEEDIRAGAEISVTVSHELMEQLADPLTTRMGPTVDGAQFIVEVCDAVEADSDGYLKNGVRVSNFVLPAYYEPGSAGPWDFRGLLTGPCPALRPGGYSMWLKDGGWHDTYARHADGTVSHRAQRRHGRRWQRASK